MVFGLSPGFFFPFGPGYYNLEKSQFFYYLIRKLSPMVMCELRGLEWRWVDAMQQKGKPAYAFWLLWICTCRYSVFHQLLLVGKHSDMYRV